MNVDVIWPIENHDVTRNTFINTDFTYSHAYTDTKNNFSEGIWLFSAYLT